MPVTAARSASNAGQAMALAGTSGNACQSSHCTDSPRLPGRYCQISSAVNERIGASQRTMASTMCNIAVCAERRA